MTVSTERKNLVSTIIALLEKYSDDTQKTIPDPLTIEVYVRGDEDDIFEELVEQIEEKEGKQAGLETRSEKVKALYYVGHHYRGCVLEVNQRKQLTVSQPFDIYYSTGKSIIIVEQ